MATDYPCRVRYSLSGVSGSVASHGSRRLSRGRGGHAHKREGYLVYWRNPIICFGLFAAYLALLPVLGMLIDGMAFVFVLLCALGGWSPRDMAIHAAVAVISVGGMWSVFTFGLNVLLPTGMLIPGL